MYIIQELIQILRWGFHCLTSMALNYLLRWFITVLVVFEVSPILAHIPATAVPGKYQWGCLPLSKSNLSTQYLVTQAPPYTVLSLHLKDLGLSLGSCSHHIIVHPWNQFRPFTDYSVHIRPVIQAVQTWNLLGEGFSKYSIQVGTASP